MKKYSTTKKTIEIEDEKLDYKECDLCGKRVQKENNWSNRRYESNETKIKHNEGTSYPDSNHGHTYEAEICPDCFKTKLIPWLKLNGCKAEYKDWEY